MAVNALGQAIQLLLSNTQLGEVTDRLQVGQQIRARVTEVLPGDQAVVNIQGTNVLAQLQAGLGGGLSKGDMLLLQVTGLPSGLSDAQAGNAAGQGSVSSLNLRFLGLLGGPGQEAQAAAAQGAASASLSSLGELTALLQQLNLEPSSANLAVVQGLRQTGLPVSPTLVREIVQQALQALQQAPAAADSTPSGAPGPGAAPAGSGAVSQAAGQAASRVVSDARETLALLSFLDQQQPSTQVHLQIQQAARGLEGFLAGLEGGTAGSASQGPQAAPPALSQGQVERLDQALQGFIQDPQAASVAGLIRDLAALQASVQGRPAPSAPPVPLPPDLAPTVAEPPFQPPSLVPSPQPGPSLAGGDPPSVSTQAPGPDASTLPLPQTPTDLPAPGAAPRQAETGISGPAGQPAAAPDSGAPAGRGPLASAPGVARDSAPAAPPVPSGVASGDGAGAYSGAPARAVPPARDWASLQAFQDLANTVFQDLQPGQSGPVSNAGLLSGLESAVQELQTPGSSLGQAVVAESRALASAEGLPAPAPDQVLAGALDYLRGLQQAFQAAPLAQPAASTGEIWQQAQARVPLPTSRPLESLPTESVLKAAVFLRARQLPASRALLQPVAQSLAKGEPLSSQVAQIQQQAQSLPASLLAQAPDLAQALQQLQAAFTALGIQVEGQDLAGQLAANPSHLGLDLEGSLAAQASGRAGESGPAASPASAGRDLKSALLRLDRGLKSGLLDSTQATEGDRQQAARLAAQTSSALASLTTLQLANQPLLSHDMVSVQVPLWFGKEPVPGQLSVYWKRGREPRLDDKEPLQVVVQLNTRGLGQVKVSLTVYKKDCKCRVEVENEPARQHLARNLDSLKKGFGQNTPFELQAVDLSLAREAAAPALPEFQGAQPGALNVSA